LSKLELTPEDLIYSDEKGRVFINHDLIEQIGLFNLNRKTLESVLAAYHANASARGRQESFTMNVFIQLTRNIQAFPFPVVTNFTSGPAYHHNLNKIKNFST